MHEALKLSTITLVVCGLRGNPKLTHQREKQIEIDDGCVLPFRKRLISIFYFKLPKHCLISVFNSSIASNWCRNFENLTGICFRQLACRIWSLIMLVSRLALNTDCKYKHGFDLRHMPVQRYIAH